MVFPIANNQMLTYMPEQYGIKPSYTLIADPNSSVSQLYSLTLNPSLIIINKVGNVCYVGKFITWSEIAEEIEGLIEPSEEVDLSSHEMAINALKSPDSNIRWKSAKRLGEMGDASAVPALAELLRDKSSAVREYAVISLGAIDGKSAIEPLIKALRDKSSLVKMQAINAIAKTKDENAIPDIVDCAIKSAENMDDDLLQNSVNALAEFEQTDMVYEAFAENFDDVSPRRSYDLNRAGTALATAYMQKKMYEPVIKLLLKQVESSNADLDNVCQIIANCYLEMNQPEKAVTEYLRIVKNIPYSDELRMFTYNADGSMGGYSQRDWALSRFCDIFKMSDKLDFAIKTLESISDESEKDEIYYQMLGDLCSVSGMQDKAITAYEKAIQLRPENAKIYAKLIFMYTKSDMQDKAKTTVNGMEKYIKKEDSASLAILAQAYTECKMYDNAISNYKNAVSYSTMDPWRIGSYKLSLANCYLTAGKYSEALAEYEDIFRNKAFQSYSYAAENKIWEVYAKGNLYDSAIQKYTEMAKSNPNDLDVHTKLAKIYELKGDRVSALEEYKKLTQIQPNSAIWYQKIGDIYQKAETTGTISDNVLSLDGDKDYIQISDKDALNNLNSQVTIEAWIRPIPPSKEWAPIIYKGDKQLEGYSHRSYCLWLRSSGSVHLASAPQGKNQVTLDPPNTIKFNDWNHIAGVIDTKNGYMSLFINGNQVISDKFEGEIKTSQLPLLIGWTHENNPLYSFFTGDIDEVRIWSSARTQKEIQATMNAKLSRNEPNLVAYWNFDEKTDNNDFIGDAKIIKTDRAIISQPNSDKLLKAVDAYQKALIFDPSNYGVYLSLMNSYKLLDNKSELGKVYEQALEQISDEYQKNIIEQSFKSFLAN